MRLAVVLGLLGATLLPPDGRADDLWSGFVAPPAEPGRMLGPVRRYGGGS